MKLKDFDFTLPQELIATHPLQSRDASRMLVIPELKDDYFKNIINLLNKGDALVLNDTKVIPSRIIGIFKDKEFEVTLHKQASNDSWLAFTKNSKRLKIGDTLNFSNLLNGIITEKSDDGILLKFDTNQKDIFEMLDQIGKIPLPPYIKRQEEQEDKTRYQTIFANKKGSVAAPTASLHFTKKILEQLKEKGVNIIYVTLHVGAGTFLPVKQDDLSQHKMHSEVGIITKEAANLLNEIKNKGGKITAVGTTALRLLESATDEKGIIHEFNNSTDIFILPGYKFKAADQLLTNFHTPKSTLFMLVCAFSGYDNMKKAYEYAINNKYRFYSYGDCCFLKRVT